MQYYRLGTDEGNRKKFAYGRGINEWPEQLIICSKCGREWKKSLMHEFGTDLPIVLSNDYYPDFLWYYIDHISEKAKNVLESEGITGYKLEKAHIVSVNDLTDMQKKELRHDGFKVTKIPPDPPVYYKLYVSLGAEFHEKSNIILVESCDECGYENYITEGKISVDTVDGIFLRKDSLNGNDLFLARGYGFNVFCTERFVEVYNKHGLTGLLFREIEVI